jgi:hypothetical protein
MSVSYVIGGGERKNLKQSLTDIEAIAHDQSAHFVDVHVCTLLEPLPATTKIKS